MGECGWLLYLETSQPFVTNASEHEEILLWLHVTGVSEKFETEEHDELLSNEPWKTKGSFAKVQNVHASGSHSRACQSL